MTDVNDSVSSSSKHSEWVTLKRTDSMFAKIWAQGCSKYQNYTRLHRLFKKPLNSNEKQSVTNL